MMWLLNTLIERRLTKEEQRLGGSLDYVRHLWRVAPRVFMAFGKLASLAKVRRKLPRGAAHLAGIVAVQHEDCGTCVQIAVNLARQDGVPGEWIRAALDGRWEELPAELQAVCRFTQAVVQATYDEQPLREELRTRYGDAALAELAVLIAAARVFPTVKRALGYAVSCQRVRIEA